MSGDMKKVTRYLCKWCGKEFHTPDLHDLKAAQRMDTIEKILRENEDKKGDKDK